MSVNIKYFIFPLLLYCCLLTCAPKLWAQYEQVWAFGSRAGLDFNKTPPEFLMTNMSGIGEAVASVCDAEGSLLFYTNGYKVWNRDHAVMPGASPVTGILPRYPNFSDNHITSSSQGATIVPVLGSKKKQYYIFSLAAADYQIATGQSGRLWYSIVDMDLNGGMGDIVAGKAGMLLDSGMTEKMLAVPGPDCYYWLMAQTGSGDIRAYKITENGISAPVVTRSVLPVNDGVYGSIAIAPDQSKIAVSSHSAPARVSLFTFDKYSGQLQPYHSFLVGETIGCYDACFSPDGTKLYVNLISSGQNGNISQYDLTGPPSSIAATRFTMGTGSYVTHIKQGPDGKLYFTAGDHLGRIEMPNLSGAAALYNPTFIEFPFFAGGGCGPPDNFPVLKADTITDHTVYTSCRPVNVMAQDTSGFNYTWNDGSTGKYKMLSQSGQYWLRYYLNDCLLRTDSFTLIVPPETYEIGVLASCEKSSVGKAWVTRPDNVITYHFSWRANGDTTTLSVTDSLLQVPSGYYILTVTNSSGCNSEQIFYIPEEVHALSFEADSLACSGILHHFKNTSAAYFNNFFWSSGDGVTAGTQDFQHVYKQAGTYEVMLAGRGAVCSDTAYATIVVDAPAGQLSFYTDKKEACTGESIQFFPVAVGNALQVKWDLGNRDGLMATPDKSISHAYDEAGVMPVRLSATYRVCPELHFWDTLNIYSFPSLHLGTDTVICLAGSPITLLNHVSNQQPYHQLWSTGDTTEQLAVIHPGKYSLTLTSIAGGCATTESIEVKKGCDMDIPNAFTPNGDGINDYFFPRQLLSQYILAFHMRVYNRWGQIVFETSNIDGRGWDGSFNLKAQPMGAYIYQIEVAYKNGHQENYKGNITLLH